MRVQSKSSTLCYNPSYNKWVHGKQYSSPMGYSARAGIHCISTKRHYWQSNAPDIGDWPTVNQLVTLSLSIFKKHSSFLLFSQLCKKNSLRICIANFWSESGMQSYGKHLAATENSNTCLRPGIDEQCQTNHKCNITLPTFPFSTPMQQLPVARVDIYGACKISLLCIDIVPRKRGWERGLHVFFPITPISVQYKKLQETHTHCGHTQLEPSSAQ